MAPPSARRGARGRLPALAALLLCLPPAPALAAEAAAEAFSRLRGGAERPGPGITTGPRQLEASDAMCALSGFWKIDDTVVARIWKVGHDLGLFQFMGRGQCRDVSGRVYASWSKSSGVLADDCKAACEASLPCVGFEVTELGACFLRYSADHFPEDPPESWLGNEDYGDDAAGSVAKIADPYERYCYRRFEDDAEVGEPAQGSGGYWRVMFFPKVDPTFDRDVKSTKEAPLAVGSTRPSDFPDCEKNGVTVSARAPYTSGLTVWWGLREMTLWAGVYSTEPAHSWRELPDSVAWDQVALSSGSTCPQAQDVQELHGQLSWTHHALSGVGDCNSQSFERLTPDTAPLSETGWSQVAAENFRYGVEVFVRRLLYDRKQAVADEVCFKALTESFWADRNALTFEALKAKLDASSCMQLVADVP